MRDAVNSRKPNPSSLTELYPVQIRSRPTRRRKVRPDVAAEWVLFSAPAIQFLKEENKMAHPAFRGGFARKVVTSDSRSAFPRFRAL